MLTNKTLSLNFQELNLDLARKVFHKLSIYSMNITKHPLFFIEPLL